MSGFFLGLGIGVWATLCLIIAFAPDDTGTLSACRAAHPGYDCVRGWVVSEAFK